MDPVDSATRWHRWSVKGDGGVLSRVIDGLDARLPPGWQPIRDEALEALRPLVRRVPRGTTLARTAHHAGASLSVERVREADLRGGWVSIGSGPAYPVQAAVTPASIPGAWDQVMRFLDEGIVPAAKAVPGATVYVPSPQQLFLDDLPVDVAERLQKFSRDARKALPLDRAASDLWQEFVVAAYRAKAVVDPRQFVDWLSFQSWRREDAAELSQRFFDQCLLLSRYADEVSAA